MKKAMLVLLGFAIVAFNASPAFAPLVTRVDPSRASSSSSSSSSTSSSTSSSSSSSTPSSSSSGHSDSGTVDLSDKNSNQAIPFLR